MRFSLLLLVVAALLLAACFSDLPDERAPAEPSPELPTSTPAAVATQTPTPSLIVATVTPTRVPAQVVTPQGTTGIRRGENGLRYDEACLAGLQGATPPATFLRLPRAAWVAEQPEAYEPIPFVQDAALKTTLDAALGARAASYAYYVKHLPTGQGAVHSGDAIFNAASLFKLFVMYEVFHQQSLGLIDWGNDLVVTPFYNDFALSPRVTGLCQVITVAEAMDAMLSVSDNAAAVLLQDLAGSGNVNTAIEALGLRDSGLFEEGLPVTANDLALFMEAIATGNAVSPEASADMLGLLDRDVFDNGLVSSLPSGTVIARKTGNWSDATNVAGIVYAPSGPYVFVALTSNGYETDVIRDLSKAAYEHFTADELKTIP